MGRKFWKGWKGCEIRSNAGLGPQEQVWGICVCVWGGAGLLSENVGQFVPQRFTHTEEPAL